MAWFDPEFVIICNPAEIRIDESKQVIRYRGNR